MEAEPETQNNPTQLRSIQFNSDITSNQRLSYVGQNLIIIFVYSLCISISLGLSQIFQNLVVSKTSETKLIFSIINLVVLIAITIIVTYFLGAQVNL